MANNKLRIAFMGTPDFAVPALQTLLNSDHDVVCVYTQPPRPKGRGQKLQASPVQQLAESAEVMVRHPKNFKDKSDIRNFESLNLDLAIVAAYGLILPKEILKAPRLGCVNIHASLLPRWRGAAPIHRAILAGDMQTGVTLMQMDEGLDTGDMIVSQSTPIAANTTLSQLHDALADMGAAMLNPLLDNLVVGKEIEKTPQPESGVTYAHMLKKEDGRIDWNKNAEEIDRQIRALNPWPGSWCVKEDGSRLKVIEANIVVHDHDQESGTILEGGIIACDDGSALQLLKIQPENKSAMDIQSAMNGGHIKIGERLI